MFIYHHVSYHHCPLVMMIILFSEYCTTLVYIYMYTVPIHINTLLHTGNVDPHIFSPLCKCDVFRYGLVQVMAYHQHI